MAKKIFVLDTCVLLHDPECIFKFKENDVYIPLACIDDLDEQKVKKENVGWAAREVFRILDRYDMNQLTKGIIINEDKGRLFIYNNDSPTMKGEKPFIVRVNSDNAIIQSALELKAANEKKKVVIVSKDAGLRIRAIAWNCSAENYKSDLLDENNIYQGYRNVTIDNNDDWSYLSKREECNIEMLKCKDQLNNLNPNEFICFSWGTFSVLAWNKSTGISFFQEGKSEAQKYMGIEGKNIEQKFAIAALTDDTIPLVCLSGPAGSGKSLLSIAVGLSKVYTGIYDKVVVMKPMIPVGGKDIGFLPGDKREKISAWLGPFKDNISQLHIYDGSKKIAASFDEMLDDGVIEAEAMAFIQGRSIPNAFIILDEAENCSPKEARMVIERCGAGSKVVLLGDLSQIENPYLDKHSCGLAHAINGGKTEVEAASMAMSKVERSSLAAAASKIFKVRR